jgi:hypothetical protein
MICGTVLSHQGDSSQFDLATPVLCGPAGCAGTPAGVRRKFELENGDLTVSFTIGEPHA